MGTNNRLLWLILAVALALRLLSAASLPSTINPGSDSGWYLFNGHALVIDQPPGPGVDISNLATPPLYLIIVGIAQVIFTPETAIIAIRLLQAVLSTATCYFAYRLALLLTGRPRAGLIAAAALAVSPAFILEAGQILTETTYMFLLAGGMWLYLESNVVPVGAQHAAPLPQMRDSHRASLRWLLLAAALFGLATLTRAVLLAFPVALAAYLLITRQGWKRAALFLLVYGLVVSTWTVYSLAHWNRFVIAGQGFDAMFFIGANGWTSPQGVDQALEAHSSDGSYTEAAQNVISSDPLGWVRRRVTELAGAYLQPHGTTFFPGESLRKLALDWLRDDRSLSGLAALAQGDAFWPKLALYVMHYAGILGGLAGMWLERKRWRVALPMIGFIAYLTLVHLALLALPRYLFPNDIFWWVFAAAAFSRLRPQLQPQPLPQSTHANP